MTNPNTTEPDRLRYYANYLDNYSSPLPKALWEAITVAIVVIRDRAEYLEAQRQDVGGFSTDYDAVVAERNRAQEACEQMAARLVNRDVDAAG